jgi:signal transduction histidine kinase/ActR/RegA family two-component response regulator
MPNDADVPFRVLFESGPSLCLVLTPADFTIIAVTDAYLRATMTERGTIMGRKLFDVFPDDPNEPGADGVRNLHQSLDRVTRNRRADIMAVQRYPVRRPEAEGGGFEERFWSPINSPVFNDDGELALIIHRVEDVTAFVHTKRHAGKEQEAWDMLESRAQHMEAEIALRDYDRLRADELRETLERLKVSEDAARQAQEDAEHAQDEAVQANLAKDQFLAALSHELRTPLTPVLMTASVLCEEPQLSPEVREQLSMMQHNIELEARLIDDLLDLTRIVRGKLKLERQAVDVHSLLIHAEQIVASDANAKRLSLRFAFEAAKHHVDGDGARLHQVFWNLLKNAIKFTPAGGKINVRTSNPAPKTLSISIEDSGAGIEPEVLPTIFSAFTQAQSPGIKAPVGLGLGLAISKDLIEMHGGKIEAKSAGRSKGATFIIELNTIPAKAAVAKSEPAAVHRADHQYRLLVVEDDTQTLTVMARLLRRRGHRVQTADSVEAALALAATHHFDLVISDLGLPDGNGAELMVKLAHDYGLRGIALSGYGMEQDLAKTKQAGFITHLIKPVQFEQLDRAIEMAWQKAS